MSGRENLALYKVIWDLESSKFLTVESGLQQIFACGKRNPGNSAQRVILKWPLMIGILESKE